MTFHEQCSCAVSVPIAERNTFILSPRSATDFSPTKCNIFLATMDAIKPQPHPANATSADWSYFHDRFNDFLDFSELNEASEKRKKALLLMTIGRDGVDVLEGLPSPKT